MDEKLEILESFKNSISDDCLDIAFDVTESTIDSLVENDVIDVIPIVKTLKAGVKFFVSLREKHLLKKTLCFLNELKLGNVDSSKIAKYRENISGKRKYDDEIERIIFLLDKQHDFEKTVFLGKLYSATINQEISYDEFVDYSELLDRVFINDLKYLKEKWTELTDEGIIFERNSREFNRLSSQGLGYVVFSNVEDTKLVIGTTQYYFDEYSQNFVNIIFDQNQKLKGLDINHGTIKDYIKSQSGITIRRWD